mmetsp:Transcript_4678/g.9981  ORF Transcript_4678/g.9981 Transcript_4678/m.9981 type:complete len:365 (-) Transcript_4678:1389-2483(-)
MYTLSLSLSLCALLLFLVGEGDSREGEGCHPFVFQLSQTRLREDAIARTTQTTGVFDSTGTHSARLVEPQQDIRRRTQQQQQQQQQQLQPLNPADANANLQKSLQQLSEIIQQLNGCNAMATAAVNTNSVNTNNNGGSSNNDDDAEAARKLKGLLSDMGMTSALSQSKMAGNRQKNRAFGRMPGRSSEERSRLREYHELTARQVADFLVPRLKGSSKNKTTTTSSSSSSRSHHGGMMSLTDVYCLFNRARGSNLISPEDLREACSLLGTELKVGLTMRTFPSGIVVLQLDDLALSPTNYEARRALIDLCSPARGRTALEASHVLGLSPLLASEQLEEAERLGWLCRDATVSTVRFYPNKFAMSF